MKRIFFLIFMMIGWIGCQSKTPSTQTNQPPTKLAIPPHGAYPGAYIDFGDSEDDVTLEKIENFQNMVHHHLAIVASSSYWGQQTFPRRNLDIIRANGSVPLIYWSPWDHPYDQDKGPDRFSLRNILAGKWDSYIDQWAEQAKAYGGPILVSWGLEMNGTWFPWSGCFYGGSKPIPNTHPQKFEGPELYKKAYRYVVDRVRSHHVTNIQWVFHANNYSYPEDPWNLVAQYYPGKNYVDWLALSVYGRQFDYEHDVTFKDSMDYPYQEICQLDPDKPVMLAEWGIGDFGNPQKKADWITEALEAMSTKYPRLKAAVFWHERWQNSDETYSNLRVNSSPESLAAYKKGISEPFWLSTPQFLP
jgi:beta-mannanase